MSIFSGLSLENLKIAVEAAKHSPKALADSNIRTAVDLRIAGIIGPSPATS